MSLKDIRKLGDPVLREVAKAIERNEIGSLTPHIDKMFALISEFRARYGRGRAIAAPQIGLTKRLICIDTGKRYILINPQLKPVGEEMMEIWDDCMSFPNLLVKVRRFKKVSVTFRDTDWNLHEWLLDSDEAELLQHEYDHLDGILAVDRAIDRDSFRWTED
ncbi:MAG: peptide deformylase [Bacteroidales bacterium]